MSLLLTTASQNISARDPAARLTRLACSSIDLLWVMGYSPGEGNEGTLIAVNFSCKADLAIGVHIRLVVGRRAVSTQVHEIHPPGSGRWQLEGRAPSFSKQKSPSPMVPLTIQAVDKENHVIDSVTFGDFLYSDADHADARASSLAYPSPRPCPRTNSGEGPDRSSKRRSPYSQPQTPPSSDSDSQTQPIPHALRRASRSDLEDATHAVVLDITTPLDNFCFDWDESELHAGRRLVRFRRLQDGNRLIVSAEKISQAEYDPDDIVISCIYREETDSCCVTSVDIIHLLQRLVDADFEVDEKNRIRRNLEGLRPITVSKTRPGFESLFQRIMDFPDPKPRKIEKDVKVFDWKLLPHALDKILSKYSLCTSSIAGPPQGDAASQLGGTVPQEMSTIPSPVDASFGDNSSHLSCEPSLDALYLSHVSPIIQLSQFPSECSPHSSPEIHRRLSLPDEQLQSLYLDADVMQRYYSEPDLVYSMPPPTNPLSSSMYAPESSSMLGHDIPTFVGDQAQQAWVTQPASDLMLIAPHEPAYSPAFEYGHSDSAESIDMYSSPTYPLQAYDAFEFHALQEQNNPGLVLASQHA